MNNSIKTITMVPISGKKDAFEAEKTENLIDDFDTARRNLRELAAYSQQAIIELLDLAHVSQDFRFWDSFGKNITAGTQANKELMQLHKVMHDIHHREEKVVNNNQLIMTTQEALDLIKKNKEEKNDV